MDTRNTFSEELEQLFDRLNRQFGDVSRSWEPVSPFGRWSAAIDGAAVDLLERDEEFEATVDLPGFERDDVDVRVTDHMLRIEGERDAPAEEPDDDERYLRRERRHDSVRRSIRLPDDVDANGVTAAMRNGVLTVTLPKLEVERTHTIEVE